MPTCSHCGTEYAEELAVCPHCDNGIADTAPVSPPAGIGAMIGKILLMLLVLALITAAVFLSDALIEWAGGLLA